MEIGTVQVCERPWLDLMEVEMLAGDVVPLVSLVDTFDRVVLPFVTPQGPN